MAHPKAIGPYEVVRELGRGGMGVVLEVKRPGVERRLALKLMTIDGVEPTALERFGREAQLLARVKHPNVLAVHELGRTPEGRPYIVTDFVEGSNLKTVAREAPVEPDRAARIAAAVCGAVAALHDKQILHRDLKPENVILRAGDEPVLLDFGLAREHDARSLTQSGMMLGTPAYMSPEQAEGTKGKGLDARTDVYGLGAILFELLAGRPPFDTSGELQKIVAVLTKDPSWPIETRKNIPAPLDGLVRRAMAKKREDRFASAAAFKEELEKFLRRESVVKAPPPASTGAGRWLAVFAVLTLAVGVSAGAWLATRPVGHDAPPIPPAPVTSGSVATVPTAARGTPESAYQRTPRGFRELLAWVENPDAAPFLENPRLVKHRKTVFEHALFSEAAPIITNGVVTVRFIDDRWLAVMTNQGVAHVVDLAQASPRIVPLFTVDSSRAWDVAVGPAGPDGRRELYYATRFSVQHGTFDPARGPPPDDVTPPKLKILPGVETPGFDNKELRTIDLAGRHIVCGGIAPFVYLYDIETETLVRRYSIELAPYIRWVGFVKGGAEFLVGCQGVPGTTAAGASASCSLLQFGLGDTKHVDMKAAMLGDMTAFAVAPRGVGGRTTDAVAFAPKHPLRMTPAFSKIGDLADVEFDDPGVVQAVAFGGRREMLLYVVSQPVLSTGAPRLIVRSVASPEKSPRPPRVLDYPNIGSMAVSPDGALIAIGATLGTKCMVEIWAAGD